TGVQTCALPISIERHAASENPIRATTINDFAKLGTALGGRPTIVERLPRIEVGPEAVPLPLAFCQGPCACISCPHLHSCPRLRKCTVSCGLAGASPKTTGLAVLCKKLC